MVSCAHVYNLIYTCALTPKLVFGMLGLFSTLLGGLMGGLGSMMGSQANYAQNARLMEQQNQYNIDMWKMNNEYNTPQAQMQRFQDAGLNPNLIYSMGTPGNSSSPPQQGVPAPMDHKFAEKLMSAFNIESLKKVRADRRKAEADADNAKTDADRNKQSFEGEKQFGLDYVYNMNTGRYEKAPESDEVVSIAYPYARLRKNQILEMNYNRNYLLPVRRSLYNSAIPVNEARVPLLRSQDRYLQPQILMTNYEAKYQPWTYWIGTGTKALQGVGSLFSPLKFFKH